MPDAERPFLLDTHVWMWAVEGDGSRLASRVTEQIESASATGRVFVSAISVWEVAMLVAKGRIGLACSVDDWVEAALRPPGVRLLPLTPEIAIGSTRLSGWVHGDPADRILIAGARAAGANLVTCDRGIIDYAAGGAVAITDARRRGGESSA